MKIKTKIRLGFGFLFLIVIFFGAVSLFYLNEIAVSSEVILKDNYESLNYTREMRSILDQNTPPLSSGTAEKFETQLQREQNNVTEIGENEAVIALRKAFNLMNKASSSDQQVQHLREVRAQLREIERLNINAISRKTGAAQHSVKTATIYLGFAAAFSFMILFTFIVNFPGYVANPLRELSEGIRNISRKNYRQRLEFKGHDEFSELTALFNEMAGKLNEWENSNLAKIKSEKLRIEAIIEQMQDAIIGVDEKGQVLFINTVAEQLLNLSGKNIIEQDIQEISLKNDLLKSMLDGNNGQKSLKIFANGKESHFELESREITLPVYESQEDQPMITSGTSAGKVYILRNITHFKELDEAKTNFIATVSHELKTPISAIKMSLKLLNDERVGTVNPEQKELLQHIQDDSERLLKITSELLDLSQVETGNIQLNFIEADPGQITAYAIDAVKFQAEQKGIKLELISGTNLPKVLADVEKTAWVLINFLSNAMRYSAEKSRVVIEIKEKETEIEVSVRDFGKGIDEQYQKRLFDRYFQVPTDGQNKSGSGLGLAISKDFIEAQNGSIFVESEIGAGSRFGFSLPKSHS
jgi:NtrC-family two-component system sensor histidine kinase KinB